MFFLNFDVLLPNLFLLHKFIALKPEFLELDKGSSELKLVDQSFDFLSLFLELVCVFEVRIA
jgi:hypothetical protein